MITAITFDLDDTLWDIWPTIERAEQRLHDWLKVHYPAIPGRYTAVALRMLSGEVLKQQPELAHDRTVVRKHALLLAAQRAGVKRFDIEAAWEVFFQGRNDVMFFPDSKPALEQLRQQFVMVALSNGNADIDRVGLGHMFEFAISAADVGAPKPEPHMFHVAREKLALQPRQIVHVGDDPDADIRGAARVGFRTVWVNRSNKRWPGNDQADAEITTLAELGPLLRRWQKELDND